MRKISVLTGLLLASALAMPVLAAAPAPGFPALSIQASANTDHSVTIHGTRVPYTADVERTVVKADGKDAATIVTTSYIRRNVADAAKRPVIFLFNGGPGASSSPLHTALGPQHMVSSGGTRKLAPNPESPLDAADLVFIDPVGTGYSRPLPGKSGKPFWGVANDAASIASVIHNWLRVHHRKSAPYYIAGESYGTNRASELSRAKYHLAPQGIILISLYSDAQNPDIEATTYLPSYAAVAAHYGKNKIASDPTEAFNEAVNFARTQYLPALIEGSAISKAEKDKIAGEVAARIGISAALIEKKDLKPGPYDQMLNILKDKGLRIGQSDATVTGKIPVYAKKKPPFDDPSLGNAISGPSTGDILKAYFVNDLHYKAGIKYITLNMKANSAWNFKGKANEAAFKQPLSLVSKAMKKAPKLRLFWVGGMFDLRTPLYGGVYALTHAGIPANRLTMIKMPSGHGVYEGDANLKKFTHALRAFVRPK